MQDLSNIGQMSSLKLDSGTSARYLKAGKGAPMILLHTIRTQLDYFQLMIQALAQHYTVYAVDFPGHGVSSIGTKASYDESYFRAAIIVFIEKLNLENITIVGESIGGVIALTVASQSQKRVKKAIASNPYDYETRYGDGLLTKFNYAGFRKGFRYVERKTFAGWRSWAKARDFYAHVKAPVKLIYAELDWSTQAERARTAQLFNAPITTIPNAGHFSFVDNPQKLTEAILA
jgi:pimeloyl-ACP methyl ester carboxylesterase